MQYVNSVRNKIVFVLVIIVLIGGIKFLAMCADDNRGMEEHLNEIYKDYEVNPQNYIMTKGTIIDEYDADDGFEISFYGTNEWLIEITLEDGTSVETTVMRCENENIGDTIDVAYEKNENYRYIQATRPKYVECWATAKSIDRIDSFVKFALVCTICFGVIVFVKNRINK